MIRHPMLKAWAATFVRRWHTQPLLCDSHDPIGGHQARCTHMLLLFWPDSTRDAIIDCVIHDQGEIASGDMARPAKQMFPDLRDMMSKVEGQEIRDQGWKPGPINGIELKRRKFVDLFDSYLWMLRHRPSMQRKTEWVEQKDLLDNWATELGVTDMFRHYLAAAERYFD